jgi:xanthine dehydrogenase small subunit
MKSRAEITFYLNGQKQVVRGEQTLFTVSDFLRYEKSLTGTKVVCAEGDCGACTALLASAQSEDSTRFKAINTCIFPVLGLDGGHLITIEGIADGERLHPIQESMIKCHGSQCGFCTPGFVCAMTAMTEDFLTKKKSSSSADLTAKKVKNSLTGNLCRCTGYQPIIEAALDTDLTKITPLRERYTSRAQSAELKKVIKIPAAIEWANGKVHLPTTVKQATALKAANKNLKIVAGATDLGVQVNKGRLRYTEIMSLQNIAELWEIKESKSKVSVGARVSLAQLQSFIAAKDPELDRILNLFASPQIKNTGTLIGNVVNGSPIGDMIPYLLATDSEVVAASKNGIRRIPISKFYVGYKQLALKPTEIVVAIEIPRRNKRDILRLFKVSLRKDLDISAVTFALRVRKSMKSGTVETARIVFGGVGPTVKRLDHFEKKWFGKPFERALLSRLSKEIQYHVHPISDVRGSKEYRLKLCQNLVVRAAHEIFDGDSQ